MTAALVNRLGSFFHALWTSSHLWEALAFLGIFTALWLALSTALDSGGRPGGEISRPGGRDTSGFPLWAPLALMPLVGLLIRLYGRDALPYWWDELLAVWQGQAPVPVMLRSLFSPDAPASDFTPPLFYLLLHGWIALAGDGEASTRLFTACLSTASIPLIGLVGRRFFSARVGLAAAFLLCISPPAIYYSQQVRCYALLGTLALASILAADRARSTGKPRDLVLLMLTGTLFLYTHYVASWMWLGMCAATLTGELAGSGSHPGGRKPAWTALRRAIGAAGAVAAVFCLAWLCPAFGPPLLGDMQETWGLWLAGAVALAVLVGRPWRGDTSMGTAGTAGVAWASNSPQHPRTSPMRRFLSLAAAFALPAGLLCLWMLPSGVLRVIGGAGTKVPGSYGYPEFAAMFAQFSALPFALDPRMLGLGLFLSLCGLFLACMERPKQAILVLGWTALPMAMAMAVQNPSMNLVRYLLACMPGVLLLEAVALDGACRGLAALFGRAGRLIPSAWLAWPALLCPTLLAMALFGYGAFTAWPLPTVRANVENYPLAAATLAEQPDFLLVSESHNLARALSWYLERQGRQEVPVTPDSTRIVAANVFLDGRFWHPDVERSMKLSLAQRIGGNFGEIALFSLASDIPPSIPASPAGGESGFSIALDGARLYENLAKGQDVAFAGGNAGGMIPLYKARPGRALYRLDAVPVGTARLSLSARGVVAGPGSFIRIRLRARGGDHWSDAVELRRNGRLSAPPAQAGTNAARAWVDESGQAVFEIPGEWPQKGIDVEALLYDDNSGVIYSSDVVLRALLLRWAPETPVRPAD
jgi:hypothetical protein